VQLITPLPILKPIFVVVAPGRLTLQAQSKLSEELSALRQVTYTKHNIYYYMKEVVPSRY